MTARKRKLNRLEWLSLLVLTLVVFWLKWRHLPDYPWHEDEAISLDVFNSIRNTGLPLTAEGKTYWRFQIGYYLMALPYVLQPASMIMLRLVPCIFGALAVPAGYLLGRQLSGRVAGWLSGLLLGFSAYNNLMASFARPYMLEQVFFLLTLFFGWGYLGRGQTRARWPLFWVLILALGCHRFALQLFPVLGLFALINPNRRELLTWGNVLLAAIVAVVCWLFFVWHPESVHSGSTALKLIVGGLDDKLAFWRQLHQFIPLGGVWLLLLPFVASLRRSRSLKMHALGFYLSLATLSLLAPADNPRYMAHIYGWAGVLACAAAVEWGKQLADLVQRRKPVLAQVPLLLLSLLLLAGTAYAYHEADAGRWFGRGFHYLDQRPAHQVLQSMMGPDDVLISVDPGISRLYLNRPVDYFLREYVDPETGAYRPFTDVEKGGRSEYYIDSPSRLLQVLQQNRGRRVWLYANWKITWAISPKMDRLVRQMFRPVYAKDQTFVLVTP